MRGMKKSMKKPMPKKKAMASKKGSSMKKKKSIRRAQMIKKNRGVIFGTRGKTPGMQTMKVGGKSINPYRAMSMMPSQFGRTTTGGYPIFGGRGRSLRRR